MPKKYTKGDMNLALWEVKLNLHIDVKKAAITYKVPYTTLLLRIARRRPHNDSATTSRRLTLLEEEAIVERVLNDSNRGIPPTKAYIQDMANRLLQDQGEVRVGLY